MRVSTTAVFAGLALAVIVPCPVQASGLSNDEVPSSAPGTADGSSGAATGVPVLTHGPRAAGHRLTVPWLVETGGVSRADVLVEFSAGGGFDRSGSTVLIALKSGYTSVTFGRLGNRETDSFTLSRSRLERLRSSLEQARFRSLRSQYDGPCPDCGTYSITYAGRTVRCAHVIWEPSVLGPLPRRLAPVLRLLTNLADTAQSG
jgi:hypothetical protein